jgi:hypothetical protein
MPIEHGDSWFSPKCIEVQPDVGAIAGVEHCCDAGVSQPTNSRQTANTATGASE